jgi:hypothetical protein
MKLSLETLKIRKKYKKGFENFEKISQNVSLIGL